MYFSMPPSPGSDQVQVDPRQLHTGKILVSDDEAEKEDESLSDDDAVPLGQLIKRVQSRKGIVPAGSSKRPADDLEDAVPPLPKKARTTVGKRAVKKVVVTSDVPPKVIIIACSRVPSE